MKIIFSLFALFLFVFTFTSRGGYDGYELENFLTARNLTLNQTLTLEAGHYGLPGIADTNDGLPHYTRHGLLQPILEVPFFALGHIFHGRVPSPKVETSISNIASLDAAELIAVSLLNIVLSSLIVVFIYLTSLALFKRRDISIISALIAGFATVIWPYSAIGMEPLLAFSFLTGFYFLLINKKRSSFINLFLAGIAIAFLINSKSYGFYLAAPLIFYSLLGIKKQRVKDWVVFTATVGVGLVAFVWYNEVRFNNLLGFSPGNISTSPSAIAAAITAFTISFGKSFFVYSPILVLSLFALKKFFHEYRAEFIVWLAAAVLIVGTLFQYWFLPSDEMWGPRYLVLFVPILAILSAVKLVDLLKSVTGRVLSVVLLCVSIWVQVVGLSFFGTDPLKISFQAGARNIDEVNYVPEFSPVYIGSLMLISEVNKSFTGNSLTWSKSEQTSWSGSGQIPKVGPPVNLSRDGGLVPLVFRFFSKTPALAMGILFSILSISLVLAYLLAKPYLRQLRR